MKIICVGRNYADHIKELENQRPENPVLFLKPDSSLILKNRPFFIPEFSDEIHYETELIIKISRIGKHIQPKFSHKYYNFIGLGIDFTARDLQSKLKKNGLPWEKSKAPCVRAVHVHAARQARAHLQRPFGGILTLQAGGLSPLSPVT